MANDQHQRTKRQHYVPRCYLRRFSADGEAVWVFDKLSGKTFRSGVMGVAQEHGFYDTPAVAATAKPQAAERLFARAEGDLPGTLSRFIDQVEGGRAPDDVRTRLAVHVVIQYIRTRRHREEMDDYTRTFRKVVTEEYDKRGFGAPPPDLCAPADYSRDELAAFQVDDLFDRDVIPQLAADLQRHVWVLWKNVTRQPLYTSDHPVVKKANVHAPGRSFTGFRSVGIEVAYPLSSRYLLAMYERTHFARMAPLHDRVMLLTADWVEHYNALQARQSYRQVYCEADEFEQARGVCKRFPEACSPKRERVRVVVDGDILKVLSVE